MSRQTPLAPLAARDIARHIRRMALKLRGELPAPPPEHGPERAARQEGPLNEQARYKAQNAGPQAEGPGWWVLAQGGVLDPEDFPQREAVREDLLLAVRRAGVLVEENVWVWDETGRAQLVLSTLPSRERAQRVALRLRMKGLYVVVRREMA